MFSPLRLLRENGEIKPDFICPYLTPLSDHPFALPLAFRWGFLTDNPLATNYLLKRALESAQHRDFVTLDPVDPSLLSHDELFGIMTDGAITDGDEGRTGWVHPFGKTLLELTLTQTWPHGTYAYKNNAEPKEYQYGHPFDQCVVVVGRITEVPDFCIAWNMRAMRPGEEAFPMLVDPAWLDNPTVLKRIEQVRRRDTGGNVRGGIEPGVGFISASLSQDDLGQLTRSVPRSFCIEEQWIPDFLLSNLETGLPQESIADFRGGRSDVVLPDISILGRFHRNESLGVSVDIDGWKMPKAAGPELHGSDQIVRAAKDGIAGQLHLYSKDSYDLVQVRVNGVWQALTQLAQRAGYSVEISDKGHQAIAVLNLLEDPRELALLASSKVYSLLREMARIVPRQAVQQTLHRLLNREPSTMELAAMIDTLQAGTIDGGQFDRPHLVGDQLLTLLGGSRNDVSWVAQWLVRRRFLFRGYEVVCLECGLRRWYSVDRIGTLHLCDGCQATMPLPLDAVKPLMWQYRLNEAVALAVDQGILPHLLALRRIEEWRRQRKTPLLGVIPGLTFTPLQEDGPPKIEVDLCVIRDGRMIVGECKANGSELSSREIERFSELARLLDCASVIYATPTTFDGVKDVISLSQQTVQPIWIQTWEAPDMLDPRTHEEFPQQGPVEYLHSAIEWLQSNFT